MTGLEKIIGKIEQNSAQRCEEIILKANGVAEDILLRAEDEATAIETQGQEKAMRDAEEFIKMAESGALQKAGQIILAARIEAVDDTISAVTHALKSLPSEAYFKVLLALVMKNACPGLGEMRLSEKDIKRLPPHFEAELNKALQARGSTVNINDKPAAIFDGFILVYGDIEINCTFDALIEASRDELKEISANLFFSEER